MTDLATHRQSHPDLAAMSCAEVDVEAALCMGGIFDGAFCFLDGLFVGEDGWRPTTNAAQSQEFAQFVARETGCTMTVHIHPSGESRAEFVMPRDIDGDFYEFSQGFNVNEAVTRAGVAAMRRHAEKSEG